MLPCGCGVGEIDGGGAFFMKNLVEGIPPPRPAVRYPPTGPE